MDTCQRATWIASGQPPQPTVVVVNVSRVGPDTVAGHVPEPGRLPIARAPTPQETYESAMNSLLGAAGEPLGPALS